MTKPRRTDRGVAMACDAPGESQSESIALDGAQVLSSSHARSAAPALPQPSRGPAALNRPIASLFHFGRSRRSLTILDQAIVSGSNFITGIILVRGLGLVEFG